MGGQGYAKDSGEGQYGGWQGGHGGHGGQSVGPGAGQDGDMGGMGVMGYGGPQWNGVTPPESPVSKGKSQSDHVGAGHVGAPYFDGSGQYGMGDGYGNGGVAEELETKRGGGAGARGTW